MKIHETGLLCDAHRRICDDRRMATRELEVREMTTDLSESSKVVGFCYYQPDQICVSK